MDTSVHQPSCFALFDPIAPECAQCAIQSECMIEQEQRLQAQAVVEVQQDNTEATPTNQPPKRKEKETKPKPSESQTGDEQFIPQHTRKPLDIPPVGTKIQTTYRGQVFEAVIVDDPSNKRMDGRSILFNGTVYRTLTAAAHAISPGINSGTVWQQV